MFVYVIDSTSHKKKDLIHFIIIKVKVKENLFHYWREKMKNETNPNYKIIIHLIRKIKYCFLPIFQYPTFQFSVMIIKMLQMKTQCLKNQIDTKLNSDDSTFNLKPYLNRYAISEEVFAHIYQWLKSVDTATVWLLKKKKSFFMPKEKVVFLKILFDINDSNRIDRLKKIGRCNFIHLLQLVSCLFRLQVICIQLCLFYCNNLFWIFFGALSDNHSHLIKIIFENELNMFVFKEKFEN
ncbi:hypothetical protein RFI_21639 [Reticulomyxa filosa]|uniref:Uncharacterized protein n=1 Tax=Reticulomyxa filosa TaxID=46433 RepID=X6MPD9_RETFI|nr:hypothetical protein RFI_21639 [Reticulomyxa filosa]|eukprot:ETO15724.1 hypothetical protein RFI_21639 [Reticulomyxa filosa]